MDIARGRVRPRHAHTWWQRGLIYHVYPRSFLDTDGDGVGDLPGITRGLAYLAWLGVDAVWISPIYRSPMADLGYDIADHTAIDPRFGTLDDFHRRLLALRRERPALSIGAYELVEVTGDTFVYWREAGPDRCLVALNLASTPHDVRVPPAFRGGRVLVSTLLDRGAESVADPLTLGPHEGVVMSEG
jgi:glycosidase